MPLPSRPARLLAALLAAALAACGPAFPAAGPVPVTTVGDEPAAEAAPAPEPRYAWVQLGPDDSWLARAVFDSAATALDCGAGARVRALPDSLFPVLVCEARMGRDVSHAYFFGLRFDRPVDDPRAVAVVGDTGCRLRGHSVQDCDRPAAWPFAAVADSVARGRPELLVHLGDLHRRESCDTACPAGPTGYGWAAWEADFFRPAAGLLPAAPWVFVRGNHESCARAGEGWFRFFDPGQRPESGPFCQDYTEPYAVRFTWGDLLIHDSACAPAPVRCAPADSAPAIYARQFARLRALAGRTEAAWLVTHTPLWAVFDEPEGADSVGTAVLQGALAASGGLPPSVGLHLAGHVHLFQGLGFTGTRVPTLVIGNIGNGGTRLDDLPVPPPPGRQLAGEPLAAYSAFAAFGWATVEPAESGWTGSPPRSAAWPRGNCAARRRSGHVRTGRRRGAAGAMVHPPPRILPSNFCRFRPTPPLASIRVGPCPPSAERDEVGDDEPHPRIGRQAADLDLRGVAAVMVADPHLRPRGPGLRGLAEKLVHRGPGDVFRRRHHRPGAARAHLRHRAVAHGDGHRLGRLADAEAVALEVEAVRAQPLRLPAGGGAVPLRRAVHGGRGAGAGGGQRQDEDESEAFHRTGSGTRWSISGSVRRTG